MIKFLFDKTLTFLEFTGRRHVIVKLPLMPIVLPMVVLFGMLYNWNVYKLKKLMELIKIMSLESTSLGRKIDWQNQIGTARDLDVQYFKFLHDESHALLLEVDSILDIMRRARRSGFAKD